MAAFYGDCEHAVLEVTKGHRVTLTYNLHYSRTGDLGGDVHVPRQLPLYNIVRDMLQDSDFMRDGVKVNPRLKDPMLIPLIGGILGFFCHHQYAHTNESGRKSIPHAFKGIDLAIYSVFRQFKLVVGIHPIIKNREDAFGGIPMKGFMEGPITWTGDDSQDDIDWIDGEEIEGTDDHNGPCDLIAHHLKFQPKKPENHPDYFSDDYDEYEYERSRTIVGKKLHAPVFEHDYDECSNEVRSHTSSVLQSLHQLTYLPSCSQSQTIGLTQSFLGYCG